jgi:HAD superfamily hydrolase (TIGR01509 family)
LKSKSAFKAVMFDLDGTLIEFKFKVRESREEMIAHLRGLGFNDSELSRDMKTQAFMDNVQLQLDNSPELSSRYNFGTIESQLSEILDKYEMQAFREAKPHPGSLGVLKMISSEKILTAVVTNSGRLPVDVMLGTFGFLPYISIIITRNEMTKLKPEPDGILKALNSLRVRAGDSIFVGDSVIDIQASKKAGVKCVAVATGLYQAEALMAQNPDYLIHKIEDLEAIIFPP